jgi:hypothetical protein
MMLDEVMSMAQCIKKLDQEAKNHSLKTKDNKGLWRTANDQPRPSIWAMDRWQSEMNKYKFTALNDYLIDSMHKGKVTLDERQRQRIKRNWNKIDMPEVLMVTPTLFQLGIGALKLGKTEAIIANKNLH